MPKVSVVVPVYGVEKYIERCARSLLEQTLDDMEFIFVDDCTPDRSIEILQQLIDEYHQRIVEKNYAVKIERMPVNSGLAVVRKRGIELCTGDYIIHCDSDDWVQHDIYQKMYEKAEAEQADVVVCDFVLTDGANIISKHCGGCHVDSCSCIDDMMHHRMWWSLCNKMFRGELYGNEIQYPDNAMGEDMCVSLQLFHYCRRICYVDDWYYYYKNPNSIIRKNTESDCVLKFNQIVKNVEIVESFYDSVGLSVQFRNGLNYIEYAAKLSLLPVIGSREIRKMWSNTYRGCELKVLFDPRVSFMNRVKALCLFFLTSSLFSNNIYRHTKVR